ncbi:MerR family transcriptional regulator [Desulfobotulus sp. H1]|uniref:MerR family transcriptional regulator n=1 Tax=Desulfobotulus pelophilus TaxID=2823377 RepID=A0ABT3NCW1_9BACT|nr:MerR family transcriptional regulator [Desulfobotulus pelophilus]MCW7755304.1 MerR family transcriptional regulator [Desulfobotulus pelophilus]
MKIQSVCHLTGLRKATLRYYERVGLLLNIQRDPSGHREYDPNQLDWIALVKRLRETGMPASQIRILARIRNEDGKNASEGCRILEAHREKVERMLKETMTHLRVLDEKIHFFKQKSKAGTNEKN